MKNKNKFEVNEKVLIKATGKTMTVSKCSFVANMKRYSYTLKEMPQTFYFEEELSSL
ncbi:hypothetical protein [Litchfieldia alkalitelluris]|uniref:hypothetical protein n=1 Tax=Litchfieldia alkalitelluris TaxID=304268 RepID=UPI0014729CF8|nr:hypothetical protein [Litchfieldia alkalitelluris]